MAHRLVGSPAHFLGNFRKEPFAIEYADTGISMGIFLWEAFEPEVTAVVAAAVNEGAGAFVDVGANKGYFAVVASAATGGRVPSVLYEINPANLLDLEGTRLHGKHGNWTIRPVAASSVHAELRLSIPGHAPNSGWARISDTGDHIVQAVPLDGDLAARGLDAIRLIKIDVEGHELEVLKGLSQTIASGRVANLFVEFHPMVLDREDIHRAIKETAALGFEPYLLTPAVGALIERDRARLLELPMAELRALMQPFDPAVPDYKFPFEVFFFRSGKTASK